MSAESEFELERRCRAAAADFEELDVDEARAEDRLRGREALPEPRWSRGDRERLGRRRLGEGLRDRQERFFPLSETEREERRCAEKERERDLFAERERLRLRLTLLELREATPESATETDAEALESGDCERARELLF